MRHLLGIVWCQFFGHALQFERSVNRHGAYYSSFKCVVCDSNILKRTGDLRAKA